MRFTVSQSLPPPGVRFGGLPSASAPPHYRDTLVDTDNSPVLQPLFILPCSKLDKQNIPLGIPLGMTNLGKKPFFFFFLFLILSSNTFQNFYFIFLNHAHRGCSSIKAVVGYGAQLWALQRHTAVGTAKAHNAAAAPSSLNNSENCQ